jgi:hypothetical protein
MAFGDAKLLFFSVRGRLVFVIEVEKEIAVALLGVRETETDASVEAGNRLDWILHAWMDPNSSSSAYLPALLLL